MKNKFIRFARLPKEAYEEKDLLEVLSYFEKKVRLKKESEVIKNDTNK